MKHASMRGVILLAGLMGGAAMATETPKFKVLEKAGALEVREYSAYLVAETEVAGEQGEVGSEAFSRLAGYIFGNNAGEKKLAMTAPVTQTETEGTRLPMTAPVTQQRAGSKRWQVQFMMPSGYTLETLPTPTDSRVHLREMPARKVAVIRYSGTWSQSNYDEHLDELNKEMKKRGLVAKGEPVWARYDPPFKPWFLRTNEILIEVE
jgi:hypothetical protein